MTTNPETEERRSAAFIHDFTVIDQPIGELITRLTATNDEIWQSVGATRESARVMRLRIGSESSRLYIAKNVNITVSEPRTTSDRSIVSVRWAAAARPSLFPEMEADIELVPLLPTTTEVSFLGSYRPPLGVVGATLDRILLRYVAESSVRCFLATLATPIPPTRRRHHTRNNSEPHIRSGPHRT